MFPPNSFDIVRLIMFNKKQQYSFATLNPSTITQYYKPLQYVYASGKLESYLNVINSCIKITLQQHSIYNARIYVYGGDYSR